MWTNLLVYLRTKFHQHRNFSVYKTKIWLWRKAPNTHSIIRHKIIIQVCSDLLSVWMCALNCESQTLVLVNFTVTAYILHHHFHLSPQSNTDFLHFSTNSSLTQLISFFRWSCRHFLLLPCVHPFLKLFLVALALRWNLYFSVYILIKNLLIRRITCVNILFSFAFIEFCRHLKKCVINW